MDFMMELRIDFIAKNVRKNQKKGDKKEVEERNKELYRKWWEQH